MGLLVRFITNLIAIALVIWALPAIFPNFQVMKPPTQQSEWITVLIFAGVLTLLNTFLKPILEILALPFTCMTGGLFLIVVNVLVFMLAAWLTGVQFTNLWGPVVGALAVSAVSIVANLVTERRL